MLQEENYQVCFLDNYLIICWWHCTSGTFGEEIAAVGGGIWKGVWTKEINDECKEE